MRTFPAASDAKIHDRAGLPEMSPSALPKKRTRKRAPSSEALPCGDGLPVRASTFVRSSEMGWYWGSSETLTSAVLPADTSSLCMRPSSAKPGLGETSLIQ